MFPQLFMFFIGGNAGRSNIEVHDIQFVAASQVDDALPALLQAWFGDQDKIHLDGYTCITWADGYDVTLSATPSTQEEKLFFVYAGAYLPHTLAEQHEYGLFVASTPEQAKQKALQRLLVNYEQQHKDNLKDVDNCLALTTLALNGEQGNKCYYVHLKENPLGTVGKPIWQGYRPIGI